MASIHRVKIQVDGKSYTISGHHSSEQMKAVEALLHRDLQEIDKQCPHLSPENRYLLLAINTLSQLVAMQKTKEDKGEDKPDITPVRPSHSQKRVTIPRPHQVGYIPQANYLLERTRKDERQ